MLGPVSDLIEKNVRLPTARTLLRPPGALPEDRFLDTCYRCGNCIDACPAGAIRQRQSDDDRVGTPYIDPDIAPCVVCDARACMVACQSGALRVVEPAEFGMGVAEIRWDACLVAKGRQCGMCVEKCPLGQAAIRRTDGGRIEIVAKGCVGCGICQHQCPAVPKAVTVTPSS